MQLSQKATERIIWQLINGEDYRKGVLVLINADFLDYTIEFFRKIVEAKLRKQTITTDWYKSTFLDSELPSNDLIIHSGLNKKTITNMYNSGRREIVLEVTLDYYDELLEMLNRLVEDSQDIELKLTIKLHDVSVDLNLSETLIVINSIAVKRAQLRGGAWSTAGKQVELPLMLTLSKLFGISLDNYKLKGLTGEGREVDFHFVDYGGKSYFCEVKLMGKGNPESADAIIARDTDIFVADKLSDLNKQQLDNLGVHWVEMRSENGYLKLFDVLKNIGFSPVMPDDIDSQLDEIFPLVFTELDSVE